MRTVEDESGRRYLLLKESGDASRVRDLDTGRERHVANDRLSPVEGVSPLETAADRVPESIRRVVTAVHDDRGLGLLLELAAQGPVSVRWLMAATDLCESDLHGLLAEFRAAGLIEEVEVGGERGYAATDEATAALGALHND